MSLADGVSFRAASSGTGTFAFGSPRSGFLTLAQAVAAGELVDGQAVSYLAQDSLLSPLQREWGHGTFAAAGNGSVARTTVLGTINFGTAGVGSALNFAVAPYVSLTVLAEDLLGPLVVAPGSSSSSGTPYQFAFDTSGNLYICYAPNTWAKYTNFAPFSNTTTTFDPSNNDLTLSNGNLTAAGNSSSAYHATRTVASHTTGKFYAEFTCNVLNGASSTNVGILNSTQALNTFIGSSGSNSIGYFDASQYAYNGSNVGNIQSYGQGDVVCMAVDIGAALIWWRTNGGNWNNSGTANPATGVGGIATGVTGTVYAGVTVGFYSGGPSQWTANFGATSYAFAVPSGFGNW